MQFSLITCKTERTTTDLETKNPENKLTCMVAHMVKKKVRLYFEIFLFFIFTLQIKVEMLVEDSKFYFGWAKQLFGLNTER